MIIAKGIVKHPITISLEKDKLSKAKENKFIDDKENTK